MQCEWVDWMGQIRGGSTGGLLNCDDMQKLRRLVRLTHECHWISCVQMKDWESNMLNKIHSNNVLL